MKLGFGRFNKSGRLFSEALIGMSIVVFDIWDKSFEIRIYFYLHYYLVILSLHIECKIIKFQIVAIYCDTFWPYVFSSLFSVNLSVFVSLPTKINTCQMNNVHLLRSSFIITSLCWVQIEIMLHQKSNRKTYKNKISKKTFNH